ncbi:hypothetical protein [Nocardioides ginsengisoli]
MTDAQATAEGLTVVPGLPVAPVTVVDRLAAASDTADVLAAVVEALLSAGKVRRSDLEALSNGLGHLHVELDELADERRRTDAASALAGHTVTLAGTGRGKTSLDLMHLAQHRSEDVA